MPLPGVSTMPGVTHVDSIPQVAKGIYKLYAFWGEMKQVPNDIQDVLDEIKTLAPVFERIESHIKTSDDLSHLQNCLECSRRACRSLNEVVSVLGDEITSNTGVSQKMAIFKAIKKKETIRKLRDKLNSCLKLLQISMTTYYSTAPTMNSSDIAQQVVTTLLLALRDNPLPLTLPEPPYQSFRTTLSGLEGKANKTMQAAVKTVPMHVEEQEEDAEEEIQSQMSIELQNYSRQKPTSISTETERSNMASLHSIFKEPSRFGRFVSSFGRTKGAWEISVQLPGWISSTIYEMKSLPGYSGWNFAFKAWNIVPSQSQGFLNAITGDAEGLKKMFQEGKASPYDRDEEGYSLLQRAVLSESYDVCRLLLKMGFVGQLDEYVGEKESTVLIDLFGPSDSINSSRNADKKLITLLRDSFGIDDLPADRILDAVNVNFILGADGVVNKFFREFMPRFWELPLRERFETVRLAAFSIFNAESLLHLASKDGTITPPLVKQSVLEKSSLLHSVAIAIGNRYANYVLEDDLRFMVLHTYDAEWERLLFQVVGCSDSSDLHCIEQTVPSDFYTLSSWTGTPLLSFLGGVLSFIIPEMPLFDWDSILQRCLQHWAELLEAAGVDLLEYGEREKLGFKNDGNILKGAFDTDAAARSNRIPRRHLPQAAGGFKCTRRRNPATPQYIHRKSESTFLQSLTCRYGGSNSYQRPAYYPPLRIIDLQIGPEPEDWKLIWAPEIEPLAKTFWSLVDCGEDYDGEGNRLPRMPGEWTDG